MEQGMVVQDLHGGVISDQGLLSCTQDAASVVSLFTTNTNVNGVTSTVVNLPFLREASLLAGGASGPQNIFLATTADGSNAFLLDTSQLNLFGETPTTANTIATSTASVVAPTNQNDIGVMHLSIPLETLLQTKVADVLKEVPVVEQEKEVSLVQVNSNGLTEVFRVPEKAQLVQPTSILKPTAKIPQADIDKQEKVSAPIGKGPYKCEVCDREFKKWGAHQRHIKEHLNDKPNRCDLCEASFNHVANLRLHRATHCQNSDPICPECGKTFMRVASLKAHVMLHEVEEAMICNECGEEFPTQNQLDRHKKKHLNEGYAEAKVYCCRHCPQKFSKLSILRDHTKFHVRIKASLHHRSYKRNIDRSAFPHKCTDCNKLFQKPSQLLRHIRIHTGERPFKCSTCGKAFNQKGALQIHLSKHSGDRPHHCEFCPATFSQRGNLRAHINRVHTFTRDPDQSVFECPACSCVFRKAGSLNAHIGRMHPDGPKMIINAEQQMGDDENEPGNVIQQLVELSKAGEHIPVDKNLLLPDQMSGSLTSDLLQQALENSGLTNHNKTSGASGSPEKTANRAIEKQLDKDREGNLGPQSDAANEVVISRTTDETAGDDDDSSKVLMVKDSATGCIRRIQIRKVKCVRWYQCMYCSKEFKKPSDLVRHIRIHTHDRPYKCSLCFRSFAVNSTLTAHLRTHTGEKEFSCSVCSKLFSTPGSLKVHIRLHTGAKPFPCPQCNMHFRTSGHRKSHLQSTHQKDGRANPHKPTNRGKNQSKSKVFMYANIPLEEPILITENGFVQKPMKLLGGTVNDADRETPSDRPYRCDHCQRGFKKSSHLKQHLRTHTGEKPYSCEDCERSFISKGALKAHLKTHTGVKNYKCLICSSLFSTSGSLKRHMCIHSDSRPYMCPYCQKCFKTGMSCKKHMKVHRYVLAKPHLEKAEPDEEILPSDLVAQEVVIVESQDKSMSLVEEGNIVLTQGTEASLSDHTFVAPDPLTQNLPELEQVFEGQPSLTAEDLDQAATSANFDCQSNLLSHLAGTGFTLQSDGIDMGVLSSGCLTSNTSGALEQLSTILPDSEPIVTVTAEGENGVTSSQEEEEEEAEEEGEQEGTFHDTNEGVLSKNKSGQNECEYCHKTFKRSNHLKQHVRSHTGEKPYKCMVCRKMFSTAGILKAHLRTHTGSRDFQCVVCMMSFTTKGSLSRHMLMHNNTNAYSCDICLKTFKSRLLHERHMQQHKKTEAALAGDVGTAPVGTDNLEKLNTNGTDNNNKRPTLLKLSDHQAEEIARLRPEDTTSVSEKVLIASAAEKDRISEIKDKTAELQKQPKFCHQCRQCPKSFKKPSDLIRHIRTHTGEKPFICEMCGKGFTVKSTLDCHLKTHSGIKSFNCHVCNSLFATKGSLKVHMRLHTGAKPFKCPYCDLRFRTSGHRKSHISTHFRSGDGRRSKHRLIPGLEKSLLNQSEQATGEGMDDKVLANLEGTEVTLDSSILSAAAVDASQAQILDANGVQLQLGANVLGQQIQIAGLDGTILPQLQIDLGLLQQLQGNGAINITITPNAMSSNGQSVPAETTFPASILNDVLGMNPNIIIQPVSMSLGEQFQNDEDAKAYLTVEEQLDKSIVSEFTSLEESVESNSDIISNMLNIDKVLKSAQPQIKVSTPRTVHLCSLCSKVFSSLNQLNKHTNSVHAVRTYPCKMCDVICTDKSELAQHALEMHLKSGGRQKQEYKCQQCSYVTVQKRSFKLHMSKSHDMQVDL